MKNKLGTFAVIYSKPNWDQYKHETSTQLIGEHVNLTSGNVSFPKEPDNFPCLVASMLTPVDPTKANAFCHFRVNCCFVYPGDAKRLLDAQSQLDHSIVFDEPDESTYPEDYDDEGGYLPTQTGVLLLALVNELEAVGAVKREKLLKEVAVVEEWLINNQEDNMGELSLESVLERMWRDKDAR